MERTEDGRVRENGEGEGVNNAGKKTINTGYIA